MTSPTAIYFHPEAYTTTGPRLMGRNAAGTSFLRGYALNSIAPEFWALVDKADYATQFAQLIARPGHNRPVRVVAMENIGRIAQCGTLFVPGPSIGMHAWHRAQFGSHSWSVCGITHTTASAGAMDGIVDWLTAPVEPWDAVICTSAAVRDMVKVVLQAQIEYLRNRLGTTRSRLPHMPVIPLGVNVDEFSFTDVQRQAARQELGVSANAIVVLFLGRLSFHAKAHPLAMYQALERAAPGHEIILLECGWHANDALAKAYAEAAQAACPSVRVITLDGRKPDTRRTAWAGADVFCSLSDNIQETFGIAPVEAMAAGLPVVVSDWDGYKETVRDGIDGFRIPTLMPQPGSGAQLALRHGLGLDSYDTYLGLTSSLIAVDITATAEAFTKLFASSDLRRQMGRSGQDRARALFDWSALIPAYESLWESLGEERRRENLAPPPALKAPWPARIDPFTSFAGYPTQTLHGQTVLRLARPDAAQALAQWRALAMVSFAKPVLPSDDECQRIIDALRQGPRTAADLVESIATERRALVLRGLAWMVKMGALAA
jgi:glycosyltransferase involved in cell wall biosynthesis